MVDKYLSIADVETYIGSTFSETSSPSLSQMEDYITRAEADFDSEFGDHSLQSNTDEIQEGFSFGFYTDNAPVNSITSIYENTGTVYVPEWTVIDVDTYYADKIDSKINIYNSMIGDRSYKIDYESGYATIPSNIEELVMLISFSKYFSSSFFSEGTIDNSETIIDVDVYKQITRGGSPYRGLQEMYDVIDQKKGTFKKKLKVYFK